MRLAKVIGDTTGRTAVVAEFERSVETFRRKLKALEDRRGGRVGRVDAPLVVEHQDADRRDVDQPAQQLLAVAQGAALALQLGDHAVEVPGQAVDGVAVVGGDRARQAVAGGEGVGHRAEALQPAGAPAALPQAAARQRERGDQGERAEQQGKGHGRTGLVGRRHLSGIRQAEN